MIIIRLLSWYPAPSISASKICPASRLSLASAQARFDKSCRGSPCSPWPCWARGKTRESLIFWDGDQLDQLGGPFLLRNSGAGYFGGNTYKKTLKKTKFPAGVSSLVHWSSATLKYLTPTDQAWQTLSNHYELHTMVPSASNEYCGYFCIPLPLVPGVSCGAPAAKCRTWGLGTMKVRTMSQPVAKCACVRRGSFHPHTWLSIS